MAKQQKLVTIGLYGTPPQHGDVESHLEDYLSDGWRITHIQSAGVAAGDNAVDDHLYADFGCWLVVILEREN